MKSQSHRFQNLPSPVPSIGSSLFDEMSLVTARMRSTNETKNMDDDRYLLVSSTMDIRLGCPPKKKPRPRSRGGKSKSTKAKRSKGFQAPFPFDDPTSSSSEEITPLPPAMMSRRRTKKVGFIRPKKQRKVKTSQVEKIRFDLPRKISVASSTASRELLENATTTRTTTMTAYDRKIATPAGAIARRNSTFMKQPPGFPTANASKFFHIPPFCFSSALSTPQFPIPHPPGGTSQFPPIPVPTPDESVNTVIDPPAPVHEEKSTTSLEILFNATAKNSSRYPSRMCSNLPSPLTPKASPAKIEPEVKDVVAIMDTPIQPTPEELPEEALESYETVPQIEEAGAVPQIEEEGADFAQPPLTQKKSSISKITEWLGTVSTRAPTPDIESGEVQEDDETVSSLIASTVESTIDEAEASDLDVTENKTFLGSMLSKVESAVELIVRRPSRAILRLIPRRIPSKVFPEKLIQDSVENILKSKHCTIDLLHEIEGITKEQLVRQDSDTSCEFLYHRLGHPRTLSVTQIHTESVELGSWKTGFKKLPGIPGPIFPDEDATAREEDDKNKPSLSNESRFSLRKVFRSIRNWMFRRKESSTTAEIQKAEEGRRQPKPKPQRRFPYKRKYVVQKIDFIDRVLTSSESKKRLAVPRVILKPEPPARLSSKNENDKKGQEGTGTLARGRSRGGDVNANIRKI